MTEMLLELNLPTLKEEKEKLVFLYSNQMGAVPAIKKDGWLSNSYQTQEMNKLSLKCVTDNFRQGIKDKYLKLINLNSSAQRHSFFPKTNSE